MSSFKFRGPLYEIMDNNEEGKVLTDKNISFISSLGYTPIQKEETDNLSDLSLNWDYEHTDTRPQIKITGSIPYVMPNFYTKVSEPVFYNSQEDYNNSYSIEKNTETENIADYNINITPLVYSTEWYSGEDLSQENGIVIKRENSGNDNIINIANKGDMYLNKNGEVFRCSNGYRITINQTNAIEVSEQNDINFRETVSSYPSDIVINAVIGYDISVTNITNDTISNINLQNNGNTIITDLELAAGEGQTFNYSQTITQNDIDNNNNKVINNITLSFEKNDIEFVYNYSIEIQKQINFSDWEYITTIKGKNGASTKWYYGTSLEYLNNTISINGTVEDDDILHTGVVGDMYLNNQSQVFRCKMDEDYDNNIENKWDYLIDLKSSASEQVGWNDIELKYYNQNSNPPSWSSTKDENSEYFVSEITSKIENNSKKLEIKHDVFDKIKDLLSEIIVISAEQPSNNNEITKLWIRESTSVGGSNVQSSS